MALADGTEPLVLADGSMIDPTTGKVIKPKTNNYVEVPSARDAIKQITAVRRSINDLPAPPKQMNAISLVVMYHLFGLADEDIAIASGLTVDQVGRIKMLEAFGTMLNNVSDSIVTQETDDIRQMIASKAKRAVHRIVETLEDEDNPNAFRAAQDILDRAGHRPADIVEHRHKMEGGLTIEYIKKDQTQTAPAIDVDFKEL